MTSRKRENSVLHTERGKMVQACHLRNPWTGGLVSQWNVPGSLDYIPSEGLPKKSGKWSNKTKPTLLLCRKRMVCRGVISTRPSSPCELEDYNDVKEYHHYQASCARMEAGVFTTSGRLLQRARRDSHQRAKAMGAWDLNALPSLGQLESAFRRVKKQKSAGNDDLRSDLCSLASASLAKNYPLLVKIFAQAAEPYQMKGGTLIYAHKSGDRSLPDNYRGLLLSSHLGKCLRRTFRQQLIPFYQCWASPTSRSNQVGM